MINSFFIEIINLINLNLDKILYHRNSFSFKNDNSPVSNSDYFLQDLIINFFSNKIPDLYFLSEEKLIDQGIRFQNKFLVIDPIDGTENFVSGIPIWGVALSYWENSKHVSSMIYLPELNKSIITGQKISYNSSRIIGYSSSINSKLLSLIEPNKENRIFGCSVFNFYATITKSFKSFENLKGAYVWDLIAGLNLALEHGCKVIVEGKEYHGEFLDPNRRHRFKVSNK